MKPPVDRKLVVALIAVELGYVDREALIAGISSWSVAKDQPLGESLLGGFPLDSEILLRLESLADLILRLNSEDPIASLVSRTLEDGLTEDLRRSLTSTEVLDSLATRFPSTDTSLPATHADDPYATRVDSSAPTWSGARTNLRPGGVRYRKVRDHARGGLGAVFVAQDEELNREVALKEIQDRHADHPASRSRFLIEAEITGGLEHPGIVPVYGLGTYEDGRPFYAMRFIRGDSLKNAIAAFHANDALKEDPGARFLALQKLLRRFLDVCNAIAYAHSRGVLHRDLKPDNVMVGQFGETLVVDWGLAKAAGRAGEILDEMRVESDLSPSSADFSNETLPGSVIGTPAYMSPEQAEGRIDLLGPSSDVYSLGATLYTLLTGAPPFTGTSLEQVLADVRTGQFPRPRELVRSIDLPLEAICLKAMALRPEDRYDSARSLADDLESWLADEPVAAFRELWTRRARRWSRRHRTGLMTGLSTGLVAIALVGAYAWVARDRIRKTDAAALATLARAEQLEIEARATSDLARWDAALAEASRADSQLESGGGSAAVKVRVAARLEEIRAEERQVRTAQVVRDRNRKLVADLDEARLLRADTNGIRIDPTSQHRAFLEAFRSDGIDLGSMTVEAAAGRIRSSEIARSLIATLDEWALDPATIVPVEKLDAIARQADPDPLMTRIREAAHRKDPAELRQLIEETRRNPDWALRTNPFVHALARLDPTASQPLLEMIRRERPADFWINHTLAEAFEYGRPQRLDEAIRYYSVAVALRPQSPAIHINLGTALRLRGDADGAIAAHREAIRLKPDFGDAYVGLGNALADKHDLDAAVAAFREAIRLQPENGMAHNNLGNVLGSRNDPDGALAEYRESARLGYPLGHYSLGCALWAKKDLDASIAALTEAIRLMPDFWKARYFLGCVLSDKQDWTGAIEAFRASLRLNPIDPEARLNLGNALRNLGQLDAAVESYREALKTWPNYAIVHCNLGWVLMRQGFPGEGLKELELGHELGSKNPRWPYPSAEWVRTCRQLAAVELKLPAYLSSRIPLENPDEALTLANLCYNRRLYAIAARLHAEAFAARPTLAEDLRMGHRFNAACTAALAGTGQGKDNPPLDASARRELLDQTREWLRADLKSLAKWLDLKNPEAEKLVVATLDRWKTCRDFAAIRDESELAKLQPTDQREFRNLWAEVETLRKTAEGESPP